MSVSRSSQSIDQTEISATASNRSKTRSNVGLQSDLSDRELQIVEQVTAGLTNQEISEKLEISKRTVDNHVSNILNKTATGNRVALVRWALQSGKVCIDELNCCHLPNN
ncbi:MAG: helix-turn-helix transcriptional regulator [Phormidesmis priestleyi]|uniref:Helix-turn-helix transcriptional regulator n=1 Tax=Phormidesmis priestleyi TaxID=268141 RepID=A0A2W4XKY3_9CYAN|nr:MAG: helix-turn-helix transcriptional regulator [Phormidesmis priestleyi]